MTESCGAERPALEDGAPEETTMTTTETIPIAERVVTLLTSILETGEEVFGAGPEEEQGEEEEMMTPLGDREGRMTRTRTVPMTRTMKKKMMRTPVKKLSIAKRMKLPGLWKPHSGHVTRGSRLDWKMTR